MTTVTCREEQNAFDSSVQVYPNPFTSTVTLQFSYTKPDRIEVIDIAGRVVEIKTISELSSVQLGDKLPSGFYVARLWKGNEIMQNIKLVKAE